MPPDKMDRIARACGLSTGGDLPEAIEALNARLGLPKSLGEMGVTDDLIDDMVPHAVADVSTLTNPAKVSEADFREMFKALM